MDSSKMGRHMAKEFIHGGMVKYMMVSGRMVSSMVMAFGKVCMVIPT
jgi:hypothetical protein